jgi:DNA-binding transcriptional MerR regulator
MYNTTQFAKLTGYHIKTIQKWDRDGILKPEGRTKTNRRIYTDKQLLELFNSNQEIVNNLKDNLKNE